ncbi:MAG: hypothetical protein J2P25_24940 [Nocardiopsaceae bacterium]|nr:hypothetical protein [Nocardiopsaceae bacterium]
MLMLLAWLLGGGGGGPSHQERKAAATRASAAAKKARRSLPRAAYGKPRGARASASAAPSLSSAGGLAAGSSSAGGSSADRSSARGSSADGSAARGSSAGGSGATPSHSASGSAGASGSSRHCQAGSIVLSLFTSQRSYRPGERPTFSVYAVSTSAQECRLRYGPAAVRVMVTRHGKVVWDSAACESTRQGARTTRLAPGVPREVALSWNREASARSCAGTLPRGEQGTFQAVAQADGRSSPVRSFRLLN